MSFKDFLLDSIKYTFQEKRNFLIFGLLLVLLAFLPDVYELEPLNLISDPIYLIAIIISFTLLMIQGGYLSKILEESIGGNEVIPEFQFQNLFFYIKEGIKDIVLGIYYSILPFGILLILEVVPEKTLGDALYIILVLLMFISWYIAPLILQTAIIYVVIDDYKKAFDFIYILKKSKEIGFKRLNIGLILLIIVLLIMTFIIVANNNPILSLLVIIIGLFAYPFLAITGIRYMALIGREIKNKK